ncbi:cytochrome c [Oceanimonas sp. NS1]|uniref:Cytochrome C n=1 Tax=Oceanimonas doudoroffii TaxID=84158 RepID=A0A233RE24_9GAMM|nr:MULTISPECIES: cytochrome c [Oceanimonas]MCT7654624.1 cytochrome c [Oceanimonas sp. NS1]NHH99211.1 Cytochrome c-554(548) [Oceanimonas sp. MB9]OXY81661.1 cytochrome C [Oceanimonas doudoroffii]
MKKLMTAAAVMAMFAAPAFAAGDAEAGKAKSAVCAACHGADGISTMDIYPNLAGQKAAYLVSQLKAFKAGERNNPIMAPMAMPLSDQDMEDLAAYYAGL